MFGMGWQELLLVLVIMLLFFGPNKLPALGKSLGKALAGFKQGLKEGQDNIEKSVSDDPKA